MANTINDYYENAILSDIAYYNLNSGMTSAEFKSALMEDGGIAEVKAEYISARYQILETSSGIKTWISGFDAVIFYDTETNEKVLAIRGTSSLQDFLTDVISVARIGDTDIQLQYQHLKEFYGELVNKRILGAGESFRVTGHSLGGFLTQAFVRDNPALVTNAYTYNAPGFGGVRAELLELLGITTAENTGEYDITNILSEHVIGGLGYLYGETKDIFIESSSIDLIYNHSGSSEKYVG